MFYLKKNIFQTFFINFLLIKILCGKHTFHLWGVGGYGVEDVDEDEEEGDEERHPAGDDVHRDKEGDPGDNHEQSCIIIISVPGISIIILLDISMHYLIMQQG